LSFISSAHIIFHALSKDEKYKYARRKTLSNGTLNYVHVDLWGLSVTPSHSGAKVATCLSQKAKDEAFENFKSWKHLVENQTNIKKRFKMEYGLQFYLEL